MRLLVIPGAEEQAGFSLVRTKAEHAGGFEGHVDIVDEGDIAEGGLVGGAGERGFRC